MASDPASALLHTRVEHRDRVAVVIAQGELDVASAPRLVAALDGLGTAEGGEAVVIDMAGVGFMDSSGLRALLDCERACRESGRPFALARPTDSVRRVLELVDLLETLTVLDDLAPQSLAAVADAPPGDPAGSA
jgi:anti-anti-sigma factor